MSSTTRLKNKGEYNFEYSTSGWAYTYIFVFVEITFNLCHKLWNDVTDYGESTKVKFNANLRLTNGDETSNSYSTSDSLLPNKSKSTKKIAFEIDVSHKKNGSLERYT